MAAFHERHRGEQAVRGKPALCSERKGLDTSIASERPTALLYAEVQASARDLGWFSGDFDVKSF